MSFLPNFSSQYSSLCNPGCHEWHGNHGVPDLLPDQWTGDLFASCCCDHRYSYRIGYTSSLYWPLPYPGLAFLKLLWPPCYPCTNTLIFSFSESFYQPSSHDILWFTWQPFLVFQGGSNFLFIQKTSNLRHCTPGNSFGILWKFKYLNRFVHFSKAHSQHKFCGLGISLGNIQLFAVTAEAVKVGD